MISKAKIIYTITLPTQNNFGAYHNDMPHFIE